MKFNIKSLLTGTTLVVASALNINAVPPKGIKLIKGVTITHPLFGKMEVIEHTKYYDEHHEDDIVEDFMKYVLSNIVSHKEYNVDRDKVKNTLKKRIACTRAGRGMLKVITGNYMSEYERIKQFCKKHKEAFEAYREESLKHTKYVKFCRLVENLKRFYNVEVSFPRMKFDKDVKEKIDKDVKEKKISIDGLLKIYEYFRLHETLRNYDVNKLLEEVLDLNEKWEVVKERCIHQFSIEGHYPEALEEFFKHHKDEFEKTYNAYSYIKEWEKSDDIQKLITLGKVLEEAYEAETKKENEDRFSCIRHEKHAACDFLTLYEHFFEDKSKVKDINNILFHTVTLKKGDGGYMPLASGEFIILPGYQSSLSTDNYWVDANGCFKHKKSREEVIDTDEVNEEYAALHHELLHFMNDILNCFSTPEPIEASVILERNDISKQLQRWFGKDGGYVSSVLNNDVYHNHYEMLAMYGILYVPNSENKDKGEFYYDPINEAVADGEKKILVTIEEEKSEESDIYGDLEDIRSSSVYWLSEHEERLVRTGHGDLKNSDVPYLKKLNKTVGMYSFYFNEKLRDFIP